MSKLYDRKVNAVGYDFDDVFGDEIFSTKAGIVIMEVDDRGDAMLRFSYGGKMYEKILDASYNQSLPSICGKWAKAIVEESKYSELVGLMADMLLNAPEFTIETPISTDWVDCDGIKGIMGSLEIIVHIESMNYDVRDFFENVADRMRRK